MKKSFLFSAFIAMILVASCTENSKSHYYPGNGDNETISDSDIQNDSDKSDIDSDKPGSDGEIPDSLIDSDEVAPDSSPDSETTLPDENDNELDIDSTIPDKDEIMPDETPEADVIQPDEDLPADEFAAVNAKWCRTAQRKLENFSSMDLPDSKMTSETFMLQEDFEWSKPEIVDEKINVTYYVPKPEEKSAPIDQIWCKMITQKKIQNDLKVSPQGDPFECALMHDEAIKWALEYVGKETADKYRTINPTVLMPDDAEFSKGNDWVASEVRFEKTGTSEYTLQATNMRTGNLLVGAISYKNYCKLMSPSAAVKFVQEIAALVDITVPGNTEAFTVEKGADAIYGTGFTFTVDIDGNETDIYVPLAPEGTKLFSGVYFQGSKVDKLNYANYAKLLASYGFITAIPKNKRIDGDNETENFVFNKVVDYLKNSGKNPGSVLYGRINTSKIALYGHASGGSTSINIMQNKCSAPACFGDYSSPAELGAVIVYGSLSKTLLGGLADIATLGMPLMFLQGMADGITDPAEVEKLFLENTTGVPRAMVKIDGLNNYGVTNTNNPNGADADKNAPTVSQKIANETTARWTAMFLRAHLESSADAFSYIYEGIGEQEDSLVEVLALTEETFIF